jgi:hypothetical protein
MKQPTAKEARALAAEAVIEVGPLVFKTHKDEYYFLLMSDVHFDNAHCDRKLLKKHLERARALNAGILIAGDLACVMQSKNDRRQSRKELTQRLSVDDYFDEVHEDLCEFFDPYKDLLIRVSDGNHESAAERHCGTNPTKRFVREMRARGSSVRYGPYGGWTIIRTIINKTKTFTINLHTHHGAGGGGEVSKGTMLAQRMSGYVPDAHIVHTGHIHEKWVMYITRDRINSCGTCFEDEQQHVCTPGYKREYAARAGYHTEKRRTPKPVGCALLRLYMDAGDSMAGRVRYEITWLA